MAGKLVWLLPGDNAGAALDAGAAALPDTLCTGFAGPVESVSAPVTGGENTSLISGAEFVPLLVLLLVLPVVLLVLLVLVLLVLPVLVGLVLLVPLLPMDVLTPPLVLLLVPPALVPLLVPPASPPALLPSLPGVAAAGTPYPVDTAIPTPSATASAPIRPI